MSSKLKVMLYILFTPFVVSAAIEFLPGWLSWPTTILGVMVWFGALGLLSEIKHDPA